MNGVISERNNRTRVVLIPIVLLLMTGAFLHIDTSQNIVEAESNFAMTGPTDTRVPALPDDFDPNPNGNHVTKVVRLTDGKTIIAGDFTQLSPNGNPVTISLLARLNSDGTVDTTFSPPNLNAELTAIEPQSDGKLLVAGSFPSIGPNLARLNTDGTVDMSFNPAPSGSVFALVFHGNQIYVGGQFGQIDEQPRQNIARLNLDGTLDTTFENVSMDGSVSSIAVQQNGLVLIAGGFFNVNGNGRHHVARLTTTGAIDSFNPLTGTTDTPTVIVVQASLGKILLGGATMNFQGGGVRRGIARVDDSSGTLDPAFNPDVTGGKVNSIALQADGKIAFVGAFNEVSAQQRSKIARVDANGTLDSEFNPSADFEVFAVAAVAVQPSPAPSYQPDGKIILGGSFTTITLDGTPVTRNHVARLLPTERYEADVTPRPNTDGVVNATDVTQMREFSLGLAAPDSPNEFQRADCAPSGTFGDGIIGAGDVVAARLYAAGSLPLTLAQGPTGPPPPRPGGELIFDNLFGDFGIKRTLSVGSASILRSNVVHVPIEITPFGGEAAVAFTLEYNRSVLARPRARLGNAAPKGSELTVNTNEAGRIGVLVDSEETVRPSSSPRTIVWISFDVIGNVGSGTNLMFSDSLAVRSASDAAGNLLRFNYINGTISSARQ